MSEEYDLKSSERNVGQLLPIIKDEHGRIVDGLHRTEANSKWRVEVRKEIKTDEDYWKARAHLNFSRRNAHEAKAEKKDIINNLARFYRDVKKLRVEGAQPSKGGRDGGGPKNEVLEAVFQALRGAITEDYIRHEIAPEFLQKQQRHEEKPHYNPEKISAIRALEQDKVTVQARYGDNFVDRLKEEVIVQEKPKILKEVKSELLKSPEFQREVIREISKPQIVKASEPCPSGVCELPTIIKGGKPVDVLAERLELFWKENPNCRCKACIHYQKCGVIR